MFNVEELTGAITISQGDTGSFELEAERTDGEDWTADDRAVFTLKMNDEIVMERIYRLDNPDEDATLANGLIRIDLHNSDTKDLTPGSYTWEMRFSIGAYTDGGGEIVSGDSIDTPGMDGGGEPMPFVIKPVQKYI